MSQGNRDVYNQEYEDRVFGWVGGLCGKIIKEQ